MKRVPTFTITPFGCLARLHCINWGELTLAWIACKTDVGDKTDFLWLILQRCSNVFPDGSTPLHRYGFRPEEDVYPSRLASLSKFSSAWPLSNLHPREVYISLWDDSPPNTSLAFPAVLGDKRVPTPFRFTARSLKDAFRGGFLESTPKVSYNWDGTNPIAFHLLEQAKQGTWFVLGVCTVEPGQHYASFYFHKANHVSSPNDYLTHHCEWDHISTWPEGKDYRGRPDGMRLQAAAEHPDTD